VLESVEALEHLGLIEKFEETAGQVDFVVLAWEGLRQYLAAIDPELHEVRRRVLARLVNRPAEEVHTVDLWPLAADVGARPAVAEAILQELADQGMLRIDGAMGGSPTIFNISPLIRRLID
jgi:hypothetical protein